MATRRQTGQNGIVQGAILFVAAECRGMAKIGGLGDVVRDLAATYRMMGQDVSVIMPLYGILECQAEQMAEYAVSFAGKSWNTGLFKTTLPDGVPVWLVSQPDWFDGTYRTVYVDSSRLGHGPFEDDATRFAFFSAAVAEIVKSNEGFSSVRVLHCHDWHTGPLLTLLAHEKRYTELRSRLKTVFTIHNLDYQGSRPWQGMEGGRPGSFGSWFPALCGSLLNSGKAELYADPNNPSCYDPMRAAIRLADMVTTVSPTYAREITMPDEPESNFVGGRGLESDLGTLAAAGRLPGILNGIDYSQHDPKQLEVPYDADMDGWRQKRILGRERFVDGIPGWVRALAEKHGPRFANRERILDAVAHFEPLLWKNRALFVAVTRTVAQKFGILFSGMKDGRTLLEHILDRPLALIVLGTGELDGWLDSLMQRPNALFLNLFDAAAATRLYGAGDVFLMPSDFEPCGISQLISMRYGCLPLVHDIGGLHDTVAHGETGFIYGGGSLHAQQKTLLSLVDDVIWLRENRSGRWAEMQEKAMRTRFAWPTQAERYLQLYASITKQGADPSA